MMNPFILNPFPTMGAIGLTLLYILIIWSAVWKGIALWKCGRNSQLIWFIVLFIVNTAGILEIIYILFFQKKTRKKKK